MIWFAVYTLFCVCVVILLVYGIFRTNAAPDAEAKQGGAFIVILMLFASFAVWGIWWIWLVVEAFK